MELKKVISNVCILVSLFNEEELKDSFAATYIRNKITGYIECLYCFGYVVYIRHRVDMRIYDIENISFAKSGKIIVDIDSSNTKELEKYIRGDFEI